MVGGVGLEVTPLKFEQHFHLQFLLTQLNLSTSVSLPVKRESYLLHSIKELKIMTYVKVPITEAVLY